MQNYYPIVILPDRLTSIASSTPPLPDFPEKPVEPTLKNPSPPTKPSEPISFAQAWGCGLLIMGMFILIIYIISNANFKIPEIPFILILLFLASPFLAIFSVTSYHKNADKEKKEYVVKIKKYKLDFQQYEYDKVDYKNKFEKDFENYTNTIYPSYLNELNTYENEKKKILTNENIAAYRQKMIANFFSNVKQPIKINNQYLTGVSEKSFYQFLKTKSTNFIKDYGINEGGERYYVPDIVYFDRQSGVLIDIEIDEPYLGSDGSPIHYIGADTKRNDFFKNNGWIIIRFAEIQVVKYPEKCFAFIDSFIRSTQVGQYNINNNLIEQIPQWTKDEAHRMAFSRLRNEYLKRDLLENIKNETSSSLQITNKISEESLDRKKDDSKSVINGHQNRLRNEYLKEDLLENIKNDTSSSLQITNKISKENLARKKDAFKSVIIGEQEWMVENLNVSHFRNGDSIPEAKTDEEWKTAGEEKRPAWCYYDNDPENGKKYGKLYNWLAVNDPRGLAPNGWHVPSRWEWSTLTFYLGGEKIAGAKMKSKGGWNDYRGKSGNGTNASGFTGSPNGRRYSSGVFDGIGNLGVWWSSSSFSSYIAWSRDLNFNNGSIYSSINKESNGVSVRCLKD